MVGKMVGEEVSYRRATYIRTPLSYPNVAYALIHRGLKSESQHSEGC
jgi:hypothetical protein